VTAAIEAHDVHKDFRIYHEINRSVKSAVMRRRRARYEQFQALKGVSFEVPQGSTFGLIGANGSGKSTLLKCLARILRPEQGQIITRGRMAAMLELGSGFHPELSGRENVFLNASILGLGRRETEEKFDSIVDFSGIGRFIDSPVKNYSSGMYVRLGFSVAIHVEPDVLLVDEVLAVGDEQFQRKCAERFRSLHDSGRTIVLVSHSMSDIREMCDHALWLDSGVPRVVGPAEQVVRQYLEEQDSARAARTRVLRAGVEVFDGVDGTVLVDLAAGRPWSVRIDADVAEGTSEVTAHLEVVTGSGTVLVSDRHTLPVDDGRVVARVAMPALPVSPGEYGVRVHVATPEDPDHGVPANAFFLVDGGGRPHSLLRGELTWESGVQMPQTQTS
jgi:ABC-type polysaccharide/polyol phosphate transport system ATPase subunit